MTIGIADIKNKYSFTVVCKPVAPINDVANLREQSPYTSSAARQYTEPRIIILRIFHKRLLKINTQRSLLRQHTSPITSTSSTSYTSRCRADHSHHSFFRIQSLQKPHFSNSNAQNSLLSLTFLGFKPARVPLILDVVCLHV